MKKPRPVVKAGRGMAGSCSPPGVAQGGRLLCRGLPRPQGYSPPPAISPPWIETPARPCRGAARRGAAEMPACAAGGKSWFGKADKIRPGMPTFACLDPGSGTALALEMSRKLAYSARQWPVRLSVRTPGFQPGKRGSTPLRAATLLGSLGPALTGVGFLKKTGRVRVRRVWTHRALRRHRQTSARYRGDHTGSTG